MNIICVGRNYIDHIKELNNNIPENPVIFFKPETSLNKSSQFKYPSITNNLDYEVELVFKIKKKEDYLGIYLKVLIILQQFLNLKKLPFLKT